MPASRSAVPASEWAVVLASGRVPRLASSWLVELASMPAIEDIPMSAATAAWSVRQPATVAIRVVAKAPRRSAQRFMDWPSRGRQIRPPAGSSTRCTALHPALGNISELTPKLLSTLGCPVTCLVGALTPKAIASGTDRFARIVPSATVEVIAGAGHLMHVDHRSAFVDAIRGALPTRASGDRARAQESSVEVSIFQ